MILLIKAVAALDKIKREEKIMSRLVDDSVTIYDAIQNIKNDRYVMPAFQRQFVWNMLQIEKLWDSILLDYPIATFLFWHVDENNVTDDTYFCQFLQEATFDSRKNPDSVNYRLSSVDLSATDTAILDGQQRLTSLFLCLLGDISIRPQYARKKSSDKLLVKLLIELNKNKADVDEEEYNSKKYDIRFTDKVGRVSATQFEIRRIMEDKFRDPDTREAAIEAVVSIVPPDSKEYAKNILNKLCRKVYEEKLIRFTEIIDMNQDDALEMFVRFNSGGKALRKSEITMSILEAYWPNAKSKFGEVLTGSYCDYDTDFVIRAALMLFGDVVKSAINRSIAKELQDNWDNFVNAMKNTEEVLKSVGIKVKRFNNSWNVILPVLYCVYFNPERYMDFAAGFKAYIMRAVLFSYFQSGTTSKLQQMKTNINEYEYQITTDMLDQIAELCVTDGKIEDILNSEKGSRVAGEVLYYISSNWLNDKYKYEQDHLHPYVCFDQSKPLKVSFEDWKKWRIMRNRLPNLWLLEGTSNGSKNDTPLLEYYNGKNDLQRELFRKQAMLPDGESLELSNFGSFYSKRKALIEKTIRTLLS